MRTFAALGSVDADATVEAIRNVAIEHRAALPRRKLVSRRTHLDTRNGDIMMSP
jgi:hypothetical protein